MTLESCGGDFHAIKYHMGKNEVLTKVIGTGIIPA